MLASLTPLHSDTTQYDADGNEVFVTKLQHDGSPLRDRASFYGADGKLRASEMRHGGRAGASKYGAAVNAVRNAAKNATLTADDLGGILPTRLEAERLIADTYETANGVEATIEVQSVGRQFIAPRR